MIDSSELRKALGQNVRRQRIAHGMTQEELAAKVEISRVQMNRIEQGIQSPSLETSFALADALGVPVDSFRQIPAVAT